jgi:ATP-binding cassette subfamily B protein
MRKIFEGGGYCMRDTMANKIINIFKISKSRNFVYLTVCVMLGVISPLIVKSESALLESLFAFFLNERNTLVISVIMLFLLFLINFLLSLLKNYTFAKSRLRVERVYAVKMMDKMENIRYDCIENKENLDLLQRVTNGVNRSAPDLLRITFELIQIVIGIIGYLWIIFSMSILTGLIFITLFCFLFFFSSKAAKSFHKLNSNFSETERRVMYFDSIANSKIYAYEKKLFEFTGFINDKRSGYLFSKRKAQRKFEFRFGLSFAFIDTAGYLCTIANILAMIPLIQGHVLSVGLFIAITRASLTLNLVTQNQLRNLLESFLNQRLFWHDYDKFMALPENPENDSIKQEITIQHPLRLEFKNVSFSYPDGTSVLNDVNFTLEEGGHYALVGENGSGKSTIIKLILRLYDVSSGEITLNGVNIQNYNDKVLKKVYSVVFQDFSRYAISFKDNIVLNSLLSEELLKRAITNVELVETVGALKDGYDTILGQIQTGDADLSGGEWQKLAIARALYNNGDIILLDEPTAALDPLAENAIYEKYSAITKGKTTLFISHRLASTKIADKILVLSKGRIEESGTHEELMRLGRLYNTMFLKQKSWYFENQAAESEADGGTV